VSRRSHRLEKELIKRRAVQIITDNVDKTAKSFREEKKNSTHSKDGFTLLVQLLHQKPSELSSRKQRLPNDNNRVFGMQSFTQCV